MMTLAAGDAFESLRRLLDDVEPPVELEPIALHLGEQRLAVPCQLLSAHVSGKDWSRYPMLGGTSELRASYARWLNRTFMIDFDRQPGWIDLEPMPGAKFAIAAAIQMATRARSAPVIAMPDPCYPTYVAAARLCGAEIVGYPADVQDPATVIELLLEKINGLAAIIICHPNNPTGVALDRAALLKLRRLTAAHDVLLIVDECYVDLWLAVPTASVISIAPTTHPGEHYTGRWIAIHSLSKRSAAPGLRSAFVAGDPGSIASLRHFNRTCGVSLGAPIAALSAALWDDESHVDRMRASLRSTWTMAEELLGDLPGYRRAAAGFFLWLEVGNGIEIARRLWREVAVKVMPGSYLTAGTPAGYAANQYVRVALILPPETLGPALNRLRAVVA
jgi:N-succinyldiaminopimelate aminotransferase